MDRRWKAGGGRIGGAEGVGRKRRGRSVVGEDGWREGKREEMGREEGKRIC